MQLRISFLVYSTLLFLLCVSSAQEPFYVIAHMTNSPQAVNWALGQKGASGLEVDLRFNRNSGSQEEGNPEYFLHGGICDCSCYVHTYSDENVCAHLPDKCGTRTEATTLLRSMISTEQFKRQLAMIIIDSKLEKDDSPSFQEKAGTKVVDFLVNTLFINGYQGKIVISAPYLPDIFYLQAAAKRVGSAFPQFAQRFYFTIDGEEGKTLEVIDSLIAKVEPYSRNRIYGTGISACAPLQYKDEMMTGYANRLNGVIGLVYAWTLDKEGSMVDYIRKGAQGILTNYPGLLKGVIQGFGNRFRVATPFDLIPSANSTAVVRSRPSCDCDYHPGGCRISRVPQPNTACRCEYLALRWTCSGNVEICPNPMHPLCKSPNSGKETCQFGGGDCGGY